MNPRGIKYPGTGKKAVTCSHPNNDPITRLAAELDVHNAHQLLPRA